MTASDWTAIAGMGLMLLVNLAGCLVAWGVMKNTLQTLAERVATLESEAGTVGELRVQVARIETRLDGLLEQFRDLNSAIRWMRADAVPAIDPGSLPGVAGPTRRRGRA
jgi:hypothetical protein